jgi:hypothetical protein
MEKRFDIILDCSDMSAVVNEIQKSGKFNYCSGSNNYNDTWTWTFKYDIQHSSELLDLKKDKE